MSDPLDDLISALGSPALPSELTGKAAAVDAMHHAFLESSEPVMTPTIPRPRRRGQLVAVAVVAALGVAGAAAAGPGGFLADAPEETVESTSTTTEVSTTTTTIEPTTTAAPTTTVEPSTTAASTDDAATAAVALVDDPTTAFDETLCAEGNHGKTVSSVAQETEPGPGHGAAVKEAAQSSCGKDAATTDDTDDTDDQTADDETTETDDDGDGPAPATTHVTGAANGQGNGQGNGKNNGTDNVKGASNGKGRSTTTDAP